MRSAKCATTRAYFICSKMGFALIAICSLENASHDRPSYGYTRFLHRVDQVGYDVLLALRVEHIVVRNEIIEQETALFEFVVKMFAGNAQRFRRILYAEENEFQLVLRS